MINLIYKELILDNFISIRFAILSVMDQSGYKILSIPILTNTINVENIENAKIVANSWADVRNKIFSDIGAIILFNTYG